MRKLTQQELEKAKEIRVEKRTEALYKLAEILGEEVKEELRYSKRTKCIISGDCKIFIATQKEKSTGMVRINRIDVLNQNVVDWKTYRL